MNTKMAFLLVVACHGMCLPHAFSQQQPASEVDALQERYKTEVDEKVQKPFQARVDEVNKKQLVSLERARDAAQQSKKLDQALAMAADLEDIKAGKLPPAQDDSSIPAVLRTLRSSYRRELDRLMSDRNRRVRPYNEMYAKALEGLVTRLTTEGKLEDAKSAKTKRERIRMDEMPPPPGVPSLDEYLVGSKWRWSASTDWVLTFLPDGTVDQPDWVRKGLVTGWKVDNEKQVTLSILEGRTKDKTATLIFADDRLSFTGVDFGGKNPIAKSDRVVEAVTDAKN